MEYKAYLSALPDFNFAVTYGSGVFRQIGYSTNDQKDAMLDIIIGVEDVEEWHRVNIQLNPHHYSFARHLGPSLVSAIEVRMIRFLSILDNWLWSCVL